MKEKLLCLSLFDGEGTTAPAAAGEGQNASNIDPGSQEEGQAVVYGKEGEETAQPHEQITPFKDLLKSTPEYKQAVEGIVQSRLKNQAAKTQQMQAQLDQMQAIMDNLYSRYSVKNGDMQALTEKLQQDDAYLEEEADERGLTVEQLKYVKQLEQQNAQQQRQMQLSQEQQYQAQLQSKWQAETQELTATYPEFDFATEAETNETFKKMILSGWSVKDSYEFAHRDELEQIKMQQYQKQVAQSIKSGQARPKEAGAKPVPGVTYKTNPADFTPEDMKNIKAQVLAGKKIRL